MKKILICIVLLLPFFLSSAAYGQQKKAKKGVQKTKVQQKAKGQKTEPTTENPMFEVMLSATAKILIVDSVVVDSVAFLDAIHANPEEGHVGRFDQYFPADDDGRGYLYMNELGTICIIARPDANQCMRLYRIDKIGENWSEPEPLRGINDDKRFTDVCFPYLMPDGITLYFSAKGSESLGGYDIFRTRLDVESGKYLHAENLGLPFNSEADDYMYVVDEQNQLAYFATNRRQPVGKTCVYTFIPSEVRQIFNAEQYSEEKIRSMAHIDRISDTWGNGDKRKQALERIAELNMSGRFASVQDFEFVINDQKTYTRMSQFRKKDNRNRMRNLILMRSQLQNVEANLQKSRNFYATASSGEKQKLSSEILKNEQHAEQLRNNIHQLEKNIRNTENQ
jgi:hypothetical protein